MLKRDPQEREQDRKCATFLHSHEAERRTRFVKNIEGLPITDAVALYLFHSDYKLFKDRLLHLYAQGIIEFGFDLSAAYNQAIDYHVAVQRGQDCSPPDTKICFSSERQRMRVFRDQALYQQLIAKLGEYHEMAARRGTLLMHLYELEGTPSERFALYCQTLGEVSASIWNDFCFAHCELYGASDIIPGMVESLIKLRPFESGGNRLYTALNQMEGDPRENLWIELRLRLPGHLDTLREAGTGIIDLRDKVANTIHNENVSESVPTHKTISLNAPVGSSDATVTLGDTLAAWESGYADVEQASELAEALRICRDPKRKVEITMKLKADGRTYQEIADLRGETLHATKMRLYRKRKRA